MLVIKNNKTAAIYVRVSTEEQTELSPASQIKEIKEFAKRNGYVILDEHIYSDEGISGRTAKKRDAFNAVISAAKSKPRPFDAILVWKFSRFARNQEEAIVYKSLLKKQGVEVVSISEPLPEGPFGSLVERIIEWMDEYYSIRLSGEVKRGMKEKVLRGGVVTKPPFGYKIENGKYVPNEDAPTVIKVFSDFSNGIAITTIARNLGLSGIRTSRGNLPDNRFVRYMLENPAYIGKIRWSTNGRKSSKRAWDRDTLIIDNTHEAIITNEIWDFVQARLSKHQNPKKREYNSPTKYMLKGLVKCSACGSALVYGGAKQPSLQCYKYAHGQCKESHNISLKKLNNAVLSELKCIFGDMTFELVIPKQKKEKLDFSDQISKEYQKLEKIKRAYYSGTDSLEEYTENKKLVLKSIETLEKQKNASSAEEYSGYHCLNGKSVGIMDLIKSDSVPDDVKNYVLHSFVKEVVFDRKLNLVDIFFYI